MSRELTILEQIWNRTEKAIDAVKQKRAKKSLKSQSEMDLLSLQSKIEDAETFFEDIVNESKTTPKFSTILDAKIKVRLLEKELIEGKELYEEFFNTKPTFLDD